MKVDVAAAKPCAKQAVSDVAVDEPPAKQAKVEPQDSTIVIFE